MCARARCPLGTCTLYTVSIYLVFTVTLVVNCLEYSYLE